MDTPDLVALLLEYGADPHRSAMRDGPGALVAASGRALFTVVQLLIDGGATVAWLGWTPLMEAVALGSMEDVRAALATGANQVKDAMR